MIKHNKTNVPACVVYMPISLPGSTVTFIVTDQKNKNSLEYATNFNENKIAILFQPDETDDDSFFEIGVYGKILKTCPTDDPNELEVEILCESRAKVTKDISTDDCYLVEVNIYGPDAAMTQQDRIVFNYIKENILTYGKEVLADPDLIDDLFKNNILPSVICDSIVSTLLTDAINKYEYLADLDISSRLDTLFKYLAKLYKADADINEKVNKELSKEQKDYYLHKKIKVIQEELGEIDTVASDSDMLLDKINSAGMPDNIKEKVLKELKRYKSMSSMSPDSTMVRNYIDLMLELPWINETADNADITTAKAKLDETHFGLEKVKERILEYLSVKLYTGKNPQTILCLAGAPGVGKTTLARSIAKALGRKFVKQSMGGVKDEAEIRGHRRTYIGALPGRIINGIKEAGVTNPVFLLDEIDKIGSDYKGDPSAALLEVLDPAQNVHFMDHYTEVEYDLSKVMFICTANYLENVPAPLRDRMEIIELSSYTELEKFQIGKNYVVKKSLEKNGLEEEKFEITDDAIKYLIKYYTREAGARQLERCMDSIVRKAIKEILENHVEKVFIDEAKVTEMLGKKIYDYNESNKEDLVGCVNGLAWTAAGGDTLQIEVQLVPGKGNIKLTGKLGDVMKESAEVAYTWVKAHANDYNIKEINFDNYDIHIHVPEGAVPKDGPSAGVTMTTAIASAFTKRFVRHDLGMTGEITLRGRVLPIGGLKEKSIAAYRAGLKEILIPNENIKDLEDIPEEVKSCLKITPVKLLSDVIKTALL